MTQKESCCPPKSADSTKACCDPAPVTKSCCPPATTPSPCCSSPETVATDSRTPIPGYDLPGYKVEPFVTAWQKTACGNVPVVSRLLTLADLRGRWAMRWGIGRNHYLVAAGLYALGTPDSQSEILVSANYKMSFDLLRTALGNMDAWILVLDTKGVNVWCAAGKGTFGTDEILRQVRRTDLENLVSHRRLIVPQLGAPGVSAHRVKKGCGFTVHYGPVRARDLPAYFAQGRQATEAMRRVSFNLLERAILTPVEITILWKQIAYSAAGLFLLGGIGRQVFSLSAAGTRGGGAILAGLAGLAAGAVLTPILLPWLPGRAFSVKGVLPGIVLAALLGSSLFADSGALNQTAMMLQVTAISSYAAMNFTGSSTYTSPSGVEKEMRRAIPAQIAAAISALSLWLWAAF